MTFDESIDEQLERLGRELGDSPGLPRRVMAAIENEQRSRPTLTMAIARRRGAAVAVIVASVCVLLWWQLPSKSLYGRMVEALAEAKTLHVSGWTRSIDRTWPIEERSPATNQVEDDERHPVDIWYWTDPQGRRRGYERVGPVVVVRHGNDFREFQADTALTHIRRGKPDGRNRLSEFNRLAAYLTALERPGLTQVELGFRLEGGRRLRGLRHVEGDRMVDVWIDEGSNLPVRLVRMGKDSAERKMEVSFTVNAPVPQRIANYHPPTSDDVRLSGEGGNASWRRHVRRIGERLGNSPLNAGVAILPRDSGRTFSNQWSMLTPKGDYWVRPLDRDQYEPLTLGGFIRLHAATRDGERRHGTWRFVGKSRDLQIPRADLIHRANMPWREWVGYSLKQFGFEFVDQVESRTVWVAQYDGRELKPWQEVNPPVPYIVEGGVEKIGVVKPGVGMGIGRPVTLQDLFSSFNRLMGDLDAENPWIIDETGLPPAPTYDSSLHGTLEDFHHQVLGPYFVASDIPWFAGKEALELARKWYASEFGITFKEELRQVTVHVVRPIR